MVADLVSRDPVSHVEIIRNGQVIKRIPCANNRWVAANLGSLSFEGSGWFLVRVITDNMETFRFASTAPYYIEQENRPPRISRVSTQFFLDWVEERIRRIRLEDPQQRREVLSEQEKARDFWQRQRDKANAP